MCVSFQWFGSVILRPRPLGAPTHPGRVLQFFFCFVFRRPDRRGGWQASRLDDFLRNASPALSLAIKSCESLKLRLLFQEQHHSTWRVTPAQGHASSTTVPSSPDTVTKLTRLAEERARCVHRRADACSADIPRWPYRYRTTAADKSILLVFHGRI